MSEALYQQVEDAIARKLHVMVPRERPGPFGPMFRYPVGIEHGDIVLRDSDCGLAKPTMTWTTDEWRERVEACGLWRRVGMWDFVPAENPAADAIRYCHRHPDSAGHELHSLRAEVARLRAALGDES